MPNENGYASAPLTRRTLMTLSAGVLAFGAQLRPARADAEDVAQAQRELFGARVIREGRVRVTLPAIAENGHSVPISVEVDSAMTQDDHVRQVVLFSPRNPLPVLGQFHLSPRAGRAALSTRIRMGGTQAIQAVAEMNDGTLWSGSAETVVTLAACVVL